MLRIKNKDKWTSPEVNWTGLGFPSGRGGVYAEEGCGSSTITALALRKDINKIDSGIQGLI